MKKTILTYGLMAGAIIVILGTISFWINHKDGKFDMSSGQYFGYATMIIALSMVFFGIKNYRDRTLQGKITFKSALWLGFLIALVASCIYVIAWMIYYSMPGVAENFTNQYMQYMTEAWTKAGKSAEEIARLSEENRTNFENYNSNAFVRILFTFGEILPVGLLISLISALILKKK